MSVMGMAYIQHEQKCDYWRAPEYPGLARPFGRPENMPPHHWRVSQDVMQALTEEAPPPYPVGNPKTSHGATKLLAIQFHGSRTASTLTTHAP